MIVLPRPRRSGPNAAGASGSVRIGPADDPGPHVARELYGDGADPARAPWIRTVRPVVRRAWSNRLRQGESTGTGITVSNGDGSHDSFIYGEDVRIPALW